MKLQLIKSQVNVGFTVFDTLCLKRIEKNEAEWSLMAEMRKAQYPIVGPNIRIFDSSDFEKECRYSAVRTSIPYLLERITKPASIFLKFGSDNYSYIVKPY